MDGIVSRPADGEFLEGEERVLRVKLSRDELDVLEFEVGPEYEGPGPHFHKRHVDSFYVLEGELEFTVDGNTIVAPAGTFVARTGGSGSLPVVDVRASSTCTRPISGSSSCNARATAARIRTRNSSTSGTSTSASRAALGEPTPLFFVTKDNSVLP